MFEYVSVCDVLDLDYSLVEVDRKEDPMLLHIHDRKLFVIYRESVSIAWLDSPKQKVMNYPLRSKSLESIAKGYFLYCLTSNDKRVSGIDVYNLEGSVSYTSTLGVPFQPYAQDSMKWCVQEETHKICMIIEYGQRNSILYVYANDGQLLNTCTLRHYYFISIDTLVITKDEIRILKIMDDVIVVYDLDGTFIRVEQFMFGIVCWDSDNNVDYIKSGSTETQLCCISTWKEILNVHTRS